MSPAAYAIGSTIVLSASLIAAGWLLYVTVRMPPEFYIGTMLLASLMATISLVVGYREWLRNQHSGRRIRIDRRRVARTIPLSVGFTLLTWVLVGAFFDVERLGHVMFSVAMGVVTFVAGSLVSMHPDDVTHSKPKSVAQ